MMMKPHAGRLQGGWKWRRDDKKIHVDEEMIDEAEEKTDADDDLGKVHHLAMLSGSVGSSVWSSLI